MASCRWDPDLSSELKYFFKIICEKEYTNTVIFRSAQALSGVTFFSDKICSEIRNLTEKDFEAPHRKRLQGTNWIVKHSK